MSQRLRRIVFLRHGLTALQAERRYCGHLDPPLTEEGRDQVKRLRRRRVWPATVISSDLRRCLETASLLLPKVTPRIRPEWREIAFGDWEGLTWEQTGCSDPESLRHSDFCFPRGETMMRLCMRVQHGLDEIMPVAEEAVLVIAHQGSIAAAVTLLLGKPASSVWDYRLPCAGVGIVERGEAGWVLQGEWQVQREGMA